MYHPKNRLGFNGQHPGFEEKHLVFYNDQDEIEDYNYASLCSQSLTKRVTSCTCSMSLLMLNKSLYFSMFLDVFGFWFL